MEKQEFLATLRRNGRGTISKKGPFGLTWKEWYKFAEFTESIDFGCGFEEKKGCVAGKKYGCCNACAIRMGYFRLLEDDQNALEIISKEYDPDKGFLGPKGCKLPRKYRSVTCLTYGCDASAAYINKIRNKYYNYNNSFVISEAEIKYHIIRYIRSYYNTTSPKNKTKIRHAILLLIS